MMPGGMQLLTVSDELVQSIVREVAPLVEQLTNWPLGIESLRCRVLAKDQGYEEVIVGRLRGAGVAVDDAESRNLLDRILEYIIEGVVLAAYQPATQELLVIRENVDESNLDGLRLVVGHELVHRGQHLRYPELFCRIDQVIAEVFNNPLGLRTIIARVAGLKPLMTLLESHAHYVQEQLRQQFFPEAVIEHHFNLPAVLMRVFGRGKLAQYKDGVPMVARAVAQGHLDRLFQEL